MRHFNKSMSLQVDDLFRKMDKQYSNDVEKVKTGKLKFDEIRWSNSTSCTSLHKSIMF